RVEHVAEVEEDLLRAEGGETRGLERRGSALRGPGRRRAPGGARRQPGLDALLDAIDLVGERGQRRGRLHRVGGLHLYPRLFEAGDGRGERNEGRGGLEPPRLAVEEAHVVVQAIPEKDVVDPALDAEALEIRGLDPRVPVEVVLAEPGEARGRRTHRV